jgi:DNA-binding Lrp family transcriptional regulator
MTSGRAQRWARQRSTVVAVPSRAKEHRGSDGSYDVIARVHASGLDELGRLVVARLQVMPGVTRTLTCMVIRR